MSLCLLVVFYLVTLIGRNGNGLRGYYITILQMNKNSFTFKIRKLQPFDV